MNINVSIDQLTRYFDVYFNSNDSLIERSALIYLSFLPVNMGNRYGSEREAI